MSQWQEQVRNHPVWQVLQALGPVLDQAAGREGIDASSLDLVERIRIANAFIGRRLAATEPALVYPPALDALAVQLQSALAELQAFVTDGQSGRLNNASTSVSEGLANVARLVAPVAPEDLVVLSEAAATYRSSMERALEQVQSLVAKTRIDAEGLTQRVAELAAEVQTERGRLTALTSDYQSQFSAAQESRATQFADLLTTRQREFGDAQASRQSRFDELVADYVRRLAEQDAESTRRRNELQQTAEVAVSAIEADYRKAAETVLGEVQAHKRDVEALVGVIGNLGVTHGYQKAADSARNATWLWQGLTLVGFAIVILFAFFAFLPAIQDEFSWERFAGRVVLTLAVSVFAAYSASQADRYMEAERRNRKLALELEALGPYLAPLPEDKRQEFRLAVGDRTFGREEPSFARKGRSPATPIDLLSNDKGLRDMLIEFVKAIRNG